MLHSIAIADTDGEICIGSNQVSISANDIYIKSASNKIIKIRSGNIEYLPVNNKNIIEKCLQKIFLPFIRNNKSIILKKESNYIYSLLLSTTSQNVRDEKYGSGVFHHFSARIVKNYINDGTLIDSLILAEGTVLETID